MDDYKTVIEKLKTEQPEAATVIEAHVKSLNAESASRRHDLTNAQKIIDNLQQIAGADADLAAVVSAGKAAEAKIAEIQSKLDAAQTTATSEQRRYLLLKGAQLTNADEKALETLLKDIETEKIAVDDTSKEIKIEGKPLKDFAAAQGEFWTRALFPVGGSAGTTEPLPTGGASSQNAITPVDTYLAQQAARMAGVLGISKTPSTPS